MQEIPGYLGTWKFYRRDFVYLTTLLNHNFFWPLNPECFL